MKKLWFLLLVTLIAAAGCKTETEVVEVKAPAPVIVPVSPDSTSVQAEEHKPFTVTAKVLNPTADLDTYWIWKDTIAGYGNTVTITPSEEDGGKTIPLTFVAQEDGAVAKLVYQVTVSEVDDPPEITSYSPETTMVVIKTGEAVTFTVEGTDPDSSIVYQWLEDGSLKASGNNSFTVEATKGTEGKTIKLTARVESNGKYAEVEWTITFQHYDFPPEINFPVPALFVSRNIANGNFENVFDLTKIISDPDNSFSDLSISVETSPGISASITEGQYLNVSLHELDSDIQSVKLKVSDGEKSVEKTIPLIRDDYLVFKNEYIYSLSIFGLNQLLSLGPVSGSEVSNVISTIAYIYPNIYALTTWGAYKLIRFSPLSLQVQDEEDISYCASSPFDSVVWSNWNGDQYLVFTNFQQLDGKEIMSVYYPVEDTCFTYDLNTDGLNQKMSYEGIAYNQITNTLYLAATGYQYYDYSNYRAIFKDSYLTTVTAPGFSPTSPSPEIYHWRLEGCVNLQSLLVQPNSGILYGVCTGDYSYSVSRDTGVIIKFSITAGYPVEVTRIALGVGTHPVYIEQAYSPGNLPYLLVGSSSGNLYVLTDEGTSFNLVRTVNFQAYGYGTWSSVVPVVVGDMVGASVSSWGSVTTLFLSPDLLYPKDTTNLWTYSFDFGKTGASQWISW